MRCNSVTYVSGAGARLVPLQALISARSAAHAQTLKSVPQPEYMTETPCLCTIAEPSEARAVKALANCFFPKWLCQLARSGSFRARTLLGRPWEDSKSGSSGRRRPPRRCHRAATKTSSERESIHVPQGLMEAFHPVQTIACSARPLARRRRKFRGTAAMPAGSRPHDRCLLIRRSRLVGVLSTSSYS